MFKIFDYHIRSSNFAQQKRPPYKELKLWYSKNDYHIRSSNFALQKRLP